MNAPARHALRLAIWSDKARIPADEVERLRPLWGRYFDAPAAPASPDAEQSQPDEPRPTEPSEPQSQSRPDPTEGTEQTEDTNASP